jgi:spore germination protein (amino acid permease)
MQQISQKQLGFFLYFQVIGLGILVYPITIGQSVVRDAWLVGFTYMIAAAFVTAVVAWFAHIFPGQTLISGLRSAFGSWLGSLLGVWVLFWLYLVACIDAFETTLFLNTTLFPNTPNYVITALFIIPISYAVYMGVEVLGRLAEIISPVGVALTMLLFLLALKNAHISYVTPVLADGMSPVLRGSAFPWAAGMKFIVALFLVPTLNKAGKLGRTLMLAGICVGLTGVFIEGATTLVLGQTRGSSSYPLLEVVRTIRIGSFVERLDTIFVSLLIVTIFVNLTVLHYCIACGLQQLLRLNHHKTIVWSIGMLLWAGSVFLFRDSQQEKSFVLFTIPGYHYFTGLIIPSIAAAAYLIRKKMFPKTGSKKGE